MGGLFSSPKVDNSALQIAQENQAKAAAEAAEAEAKKKALDEANERREAHVVASGRQSTILAGEVKDEGNNLLGS